MNYGNLIHTYRKKNNMSQKELAQNICTQSVISKIEKNQLTPSIDLFFTLVKRLHIPADEFSEIFYIRTTPDTLNKHKILSILETRNYIELKKYLESIDKTMLSKLEEQYMTYYQSILLYHLHNHLSDAISSLIHLKETLDKTEETFELYANITHSLASFYMESNDLSQVLTCLEEIYTLLPYLTETEFITKYYYSYARCLHSLNKNQEAIEKANLGIKNSVDNHSLYIVADLLLLKSYILKDMTLFSLALDHCNTAELLYTLSNNIVCIDYTKALKHTLQELINQ
ncbi:helix-turn-helix domain-containing protein [Granulicatella sp. zg-ZJ]|uniref:helix-turn-helix domain-containing protein n=1 Tax=Granulicatella sp. zg-ZJ TaxID=2678504 RepID=UPI0013D85E59|nr:helix-turn-helix domain-containing protein [Granulicatella sp. zg-ZJ]